MKLLSATLFSMVLALLGLCSPVLAAGNTRFWAGGAGGVQIYSGGKQTIYGIEANAIVSPNFQVGAYFFESKLGSVTVGPLTVTINQEYFGLQGFFYPSRLFFLGARGGMTQLKATTSGFGLAASNTSGSYLTAAPVLGLDIHLGDSISFGPEASYVVIAGGATKSSLIQAMGTLKIWF